jgi:hypothetical protein
VDKEEVVWLDENGNSYREEYVYCKACAKKLFKTQEIGIGFDRVTGLRNDGDMVIKCPSYTGGMNLIGHDRWVYTVLKF